MFKKIFFSIIIISLAQCKPQTKHKDITILVDTKAEDQIIFQRDGNETLTFKRSIQVIKNEISDTILLGNAILVPGQIGRISYTKIRNKENTAVAPQYLNNGTDRLIITPYKGKISFGKLELILELEDQ